MGEELPAPGMAATPPQPTGGGATLDGGSASAVAAVAASVHEEVEPLLRTARGLLCSRNAGAVMSAHAVSDEDVLAQAARYARGGASYSEEEISDSESEVGVGPQCVLCGSEDGSTKQFFDMRPEGQARARALAHPQQ